MKRTKQLLFAVLCALCLQAEAARKANILFLAVDDLRPELVVDAQIGRMVPGLDEAGVRDSTILIRWGDHGWQLGDMGIWGKAANYEAATRVPLLLWTPDMPKARRGAKTDALVELIDMYPTLCDLAS